MKSTVYGMLIGPSGLNMRSSFSTDPARMWAPITYERYATPSENVRNAQRPIPINVDHDRDNPVGAVVHLERRADQSLWFVGHVRGIQPMPGSKYFASIEATMTPEGTDIRIDGVGLVDGTAMLGTRPLTFLPDGILDYRGAVRRWSPLDPWPRELLERATDSHLRRRSGDPIYVRGETAGPNAYVPDGAGGYVLRDEQPTGRIEHSGHRGRVLNVR